MDEVPNAPPQSDVPLEYEETPVITPVAETPVGTPPAPPPESVGQGPVAAAPYKKSSSLMSFLGNITLFIILFVAGVGLSLFLRQYLPSGVPTGPAVQPSLPTSAPTLSTTQPSPDPYATWKTYQTVSGTTRQPIVGISFKLPPDIPAPICDGGNCASQGTYLPGGSRLTVAPRGVGQLLSDYRGRIVSDLAGQAFNLKQASVSGKPAVEFSGLFTGTTNGGYAFNQMHGFMIEVTDALSLEINHFTPSGVNADFTSDDTLFNKIIQSLDFSLGTVPKVTATPTIVSSPTQSATSPAVNPYSY